ncbi:unnamed protein product [Arabis nemorensis]|uniref:DUF7870 domain-containing protein n=1 Tax=Arabis nemorensis TaxID=586526 RepID=A0A565CHF3_9BRAS|nr:unnamed protein product [Arabis nemorensis]
MGIKILKLNNFRGPTNRHALFRALIIVSALSIVPLMELLPGTEVTGKNLVLDKLVKAFRGKFEIEQYPEVVIADLVEELMGLKLLHFDYSKVLCIGPGSDSVVSVLKEIGFSNVRGFPKFSFMRRKRIYELELSGESSFDLVFCRDVDRVASPALLVFEMERVMKPGGIGAVLTRSNGNGLVKSVTSVSFWLKQSEIVHVNYLDEFTVIVFKRNVTGTDVPYIGKSQLHGDCESVDTNRPYIGFMEPLLEQKPVDFPKSVAYLPKFIDISLKKRLVYIDIGAGEHLDVKLAPNWFLPSYPIDSKAFDVYFVDHNTSVMISYVKKPGVTFVYHPGLADENTTGKNRTPFQQLEPFPEDEGFDFLAWFVETAKLADFVVLKMNTSQVEMKFLSLLLETGAICYVDELFLRCSDHKADCIKILETLRSRGVFVHQWWED